MPSVMDKSSSKKRASVSIDCLKTEVQHQLSQLKQQKTMSQKQQNHRFRTDSSRCHGSGGGGVNAFYWRQIFALDYVVVNT